MANEYYSVASNNDYVVSENVQGYNTCRTTARNISRASARGIYMEMSKEELVELVMELNDALDKALLSSGDRQPIYLPFKPYTYTPCSDWKHCTNPHKDCFGCPLTSVDGGDTITVTNTKHYGQ